MEVRGKAKTAVSAAGLPLKNKSLNPLVKLNLRTTPYPLKTRRLLNSRHFKSKPCLFD